MILVTFLKKNCYIAMVFFNGTKHYQMSHFFCQSTVRIHCNLARIHCTSEWYDTHSGHTDGFK